jgi:hypothetical protein
LRAYYFGYVTGSATTKCPSSSTVIILIKASSSKTNTERRSGTLFLFCLQPESPIYQLRLAALIAEKAAIAIDESNDQIEMATLAARHVAQLAQQLEELWLELHNAACGASYAAAP